MDEEIAAELNVENINAHLRDVGIKLKSDPIPAEEEIVVVEEEEDLEEQPQMSQVEMLATMQYDKILGVALNKMSFEALCRATKIAKFRMKYLLKGAMKPTQEEVLRIAKMYEEVKDKPSIITAAEKQMLMAQLKMMQHGYSVTAVDDFMKKSK